MLLKLVRGMGASRDDGAALIAVVGVMAAALVAAALIVTSTVGAFRLSSASRAGMQSQAAADAGIAAARAGLYVTNNCAAQSQPGVYASTGDVNYTATVYYGSGSGWTAGCPVSGAAQLRIVSVGTATARGVAKASALDTTTVEAVFNFVWPGVKPSGVAMYLYGGATVQANSSLDLSESPKAGLVTKNGSVVCAKNNTVVNGNVLVNGNLDLGTNSCSINGSAWVSGAVTLGSKGSISGDLSAGSVTPNPPGKQVGGTYTQGGAMPSSPPWVDIPYAPATWVSTSGTPYEVQTVSGGACTFPSGPIGGTTPGSPAIINALSCTGGPLVSNNTTISLTSDVVIFAKQFNFGSINSLRFTSATATRHKLWFVTPDNLADQSPTCQSDEGEFSVNNGFVIDSTLDAMLYTPCAFTGKNGFTWRGQIYAGGYSTLNNNPTYTFAPLGIAGANLDSGAITTGATTPQPGTLVSNRNLSYGG